MLLIRHQYLSILLISLLSSSALSFIFARDNIYLPKLFTTIKV